MNTLQKLFFIYFSIFFSIASWAFKGNPDENRFKCKALSLDLRSPDAAVSKCYDNKLQKIVIIKFVPQQDSNYGEALNEVAILEYLKNLPGKPAIELYEHIVNENGSYAILEYAEGGDLLDLLLKEDKENTPSTRELFHNAMKALAQLHKNRIAHLDIKPENIFISKTADGQHTVKLGDFGTAEHFEENVKTITKRKGTYYYMPYEVYHAGMPTDKGPILSYDPFKADVYSAGMMLIAMLTSTQIYEKPTMKDGKFKWAYDNRKIGGFRAYLEVMIEKEKIIPVEEKALDLIEQMTNFNQNLRPSIEEVLQHPWFNEKLEMKE